MTTTESKVFVTNRVARTLRQSGLALTPGSTASEEDVRAACRAIAGKRTQAVLDAVASAPSGAYVAVGGFCSMPEGRVFWASRIRGTDRVHIQSDHRVNSTFTTASRDELRDGAIHVSDRTRGAIMDGLESTYDADLARREAGLLRACGLKAR